MKRILLLLSLVLAMPALAATTAFVNVHVVPMDRERTLTRQTVIVEDDRITAIGRDIPVPAGATRIEGGGRLWLSPGLADMHIHAEKPPELAGWLASGVTSVLHMGGAAARLVDRTAPAANRGAIASPHIYTAYLVDGTPAYNGLVIRTPEEARAIALLAKANGYDFLKVYVGLTPEVFEALAAEARRLNIPIVGHGVYAVRIDRQLELGQAMIAHLEEFFYSWLLPPGAQQTDAPPDEARIPEAVAMVKRLGGTVTADLITYQQIASLMGHPEKLAAIRADPRFAQLHPDSRLAWMASDYFGKTARLEARAAYLAKLVKAFADAGIELTAGTDAPTIPGLFPGDSLHDGLSALVGAGLSRYQALATATRMPGAFIHRTKGGTPFGTVAAGSRADLLLSTANPLDDLDTLRQPLGVMAGGVWRDRATLDAELAKARASYREIETGAIEPASQE